MSNVKVGQKLIAVNECVMDYTGETTLTLGEEYEIIEIHSPDEKWGHFDIIDDKGTKHGFDLDCIDEEGQHGLYFHSANFEPKVEITQKRYDELLEREAYAQALEAAGVDNWCGHDDAMDLLGDDDGE